MLILVSLCAINDQSKEDPPQSSECMCFVGGFVLLLSLCRSEKGKNTQVEKQFKCKPNVMTLPMMLGH